MKHAVEIGSGAMIRIPSSGIHNLIGAGFEDTETYRQHVDRLSLLPLFKNSNIDLKIDFKERKRLWTRLK